MRLKAKHIDSGQKIIRIEQSKGREDRNVMLSDEMLGLLRQWWKARMRQSVQVGPAAAENTAKKQPRPCRCRPPSTTYESTNNA